VLDGISWVMKMAVSCSAGSTQKKVLAAPPQASSPGLDRTLLADRVEQDREPEAVADPVEGGLGEQPPPERLEIGPAGQVVAGHVGQGAAAEQARPVQLAPGSRPG
jgi:hypothetical protein